MATDESNDNPDLPTQVELRVAGVRRLLSGVRIAVVGCGFHSAAYEVALAYAAAADHQETRAREIQREIDYIASLASYVPLRDYAEDRIKELALCEFAAPAAEQTDCGFCVPPAVRPSTRYTSQHTRRIFARRARDSL